MDATRLKTDCDVVDETSYVRPTGAPATRKINLFADTSMILKSVIGFLHVSDLLTNESMIQHEMTKRLPTVTEFELKCYTTCIWFTAYCLTQERKRLSSRALPEVTATTSDSTAQQTVERDNRSCSSFVVEQSCDWNPIISAVVGTVTSSSCFALANCAKADAANCAITNSETAPRTKDDVEPSSSSTSTGSSCVELATCIKRECDGGPMLDCKIASEISACGVEREITLNTTAHPVTAAFPGAVTSANAVGTADSEPSEFDGSISVKYELKDCYVLLERLDPHPSAGIPAAVRFNVTSDVPKTGAVSNVYGTIGQPHNSDITPFHDEGAISTRYYLAERQRVKSSGRIRTAEQTSPKLPSRTCSCRVKTSQCSIRGSSSFLRSSHLRCHNCIHSGVEKYMCDVRGSSLSGSDSLRSHEIIHTGQKQYVCSTCGSAFATRSNLSRHEYLHTGEKPHVCNTCGFAFALRSDLSRHEFLHVGKKPHVCNTCGAAFARRDVLRLHHIRRHGVKKSLKSVSKDISNSDSARELGKVVQATEVFESESIQQKC